MSTLISLQALRRHKVINDAGDAVGRVEDFMFDPEEGGVHFIIISAGGVLGVGDRLFAVPFSVAEIDTVKEHVVLRYAVEDLKLAPGFGRERWPDFAPDYRRDIEGFYAARHRKGD